MNRILTASAIVALAAFSVAPALAAASTAKAPAATTMTKAMTPAKPKAVTFKSIDTNHDGKISLAEVQKVWPTVTKDEFAKFDKKTGSLDHAELAALVKSLQPAKTAAK